MNVAKPESFKFNLCVCVCVCGIEAYIKFILLLNVVIIEFFFLLIVFENIIIIESFFFVSLSESKYFKNSLRRKSRRKFVLKSEYQYFQCGEWIKIEAL